MKYIAKVHIKIRAGCLSPNGKDHYYLMAFDLGWLHTAFWPFEWKLDSWLVR